ncbi:protein kinase [Nonomuraea antimicrobica]
MSDATPSLVADRYRLDERIGSGPMGEVWRGYDTRADWVVAVKVLGARAAGATTREVLRQHAQAVARVIHPNVAMVLDVGEHDGAPFLVMEYLTGLSLGEELAARQTLKIVEVCDLIGHAAAGLEAAHRAGVVHGQVDPDAFRMAASGVLKVVGFGMDGREPVRGSGRYAAPERTTGEPAQAPGDVYALGCVCYELLCGRPPSRTSRGGPADAARPAQRDQGGGAGRAGPAGAGHDRRGSRGATRQRGVDQADAGRHRPPEARSRHWGPAADAPDTLGRDRGRDLSASDGGPSASDGGLPTRHGHPSGSPRRRRAGVYAGGDRDPPRRRGWRPWWCGRDGAGRGHRGLSGG